MRDRRRRGGWKQKRPPAPNLFLAVLISLHTGLRRGNVMGEKQGIRWRDIDLGKRRIDIDAARMKGDEDYRGAIHPELEAALREELRQRGKVSPNSLVLNEQRMDKAFKSACRRADLPAIRWHCLRHTFATWAERICRVSVYRALMAHEPKEVGEIYTHPTFEEIKAAIDSLPWLEQEREDRPQSEAVAPW